MQKNYTKQIVLSSLFIAIGVIFSLFSVMVFDGGMRIGISSYFTVLPSLMFGPIFGGISMGLADVISYIIKPEGAYLLPLTITAILGGVLRGVLWYLLKKKKISFLPCLVFFILVMLFGAFNWQYKADNSYTGFIAVLEKKLPVASIIPMIFGVLSTILIVLNKLLPQKYKYDKYINIMVVLMISNIIITTINTYLLMLLIPSLSKLAFITFYIPRLVEEIANTSVQSFVVSYLMKLTKKFS